jgi:hypothetical protein
MAKPLLAVRIRAPNLNFLTLHVSAGEATGGGGMLVWSFTMCVIVKQ